MVPEESVTTRVGGIPTFTGHAPAGSPGPTSELVPESAAERQLFLVDHIIGLRAQLAEETIRHQVERAALRRALDETRAELHLTRVSDAELRRRLEERDHTITDLSDELHRTRLSDATLRAAEATLSGRIADADAEVTALAAELAEVRAERDALGASAAVVWSGRLGRIGDAVAQPLKVRRR